MLLTESEMKVREVAFGLAGLHQAGVELSDQALGVIVNQEGIDAAAVDATIMQLSQDGQISPLVATLLNQRLYTLFGD